MQYNRTGSPDAAPAAPPMAELPNAVGAAESDVGSSQQGVGSSQQGVGSSQQGVGTSQQGVGTSQQGVGSSQQGVGTSPQPVAPTGPRRPTTFAANASIERRLMSAQLAIDGVLADESLQAALDACGYDMAQLQQGKLLYEEALALCQERHATFGDRLTATDARDLAQEQAHALYMRHIAIARVAFRGNRGVAEKLDLTARKHTQAGWLLQARQFYTNALGDASIIGRLAQYRLAQDQLVEGQRQVSMVAAEAVTRQRHKTVAKETKKSRDAALDALNQWMRDFREITRVALTDQPQVRKN